LDCDTRDTVYEKALAMAVSVFGKNAR
jgi:hypothetical protein